MDKVIPSPGNISFRWLGQSGFLICLSDGTAIVVDPYLSTTLEEATRNQSWKRHIRMMDIPVPPEELDEVNYILISHDHRDHYDYASVKPIATCSRQARIIAPNTMEDHLLKDGFHDMVLLDDGKSFHTDSFQCIALKAAHNDFMRSDAGYPFLSYIIKEDGGLTFFLAGDTVYYPGMEDILRSYDIDVAFLPINGWSEELIEKGFASNLTFREAVDIALSARIGAVVPCHYGMFTINTEQVGRFVNYANQRGLKYIVPTDGDIFSVGKRGDFTWKSL